MVVMTAKVSKAKLIAFFCVLAAVICIVAIGDSAPKARLFEAGADHYMKDFSEFDCAWLQF